MMVLADHISFERSALKNGRQRDEADAADDFGGVQVCGGPEHEVARAEAEAAPVGEQVADGHLAGDIGVVHLEVGHVVDHAVAPLQLAFVDEDGEGGGGEGFGVGGDGEKRVFGDGIGLV
jgi:hypothetical protein